MAGANAPNEAGIKDSTMTPQRLPTASTSRSQSQGIEEAHAVMQVISDHEEPETMDFDTASIYPTHNYRSTPRSYDLESLMSTRSLYEKELNYTMENGRRYEKKYFAPNDEIEQDRLHITHQTYLCLFNNELTAVPLENPTKILDIGTGTGDWAIEMGERYPKAEVIGTDLSAIQPTAIPSNVYFEIDDAEDETGWTFHPSSFDLIHLRGMSGCFSSWHTIYSSSLATLRPGGWIEIIDFVDWSSPSFSSYFPSTSPLHNFLSTIVNCSEKIGRPLSQAHLDVKVLQDIGFVECDIKRWEIPIGDWRKDAGGKSMGKLWLLGILEGFEALGLRLLTREAGWSVDEVGRVCEGLRAELMGIVKSGRGEGMAAGLKVLIGRKPVPGEGKGGDK